MSGRPPAGRLGADLFGEMYQRHSAGLRGWARRWAQDNDDLEDMVQNAWTRIWEKRALYSGRGSPGGWVWVTALNSFKAQKRANETRRRNELEAACQHESVAWLTKFEPPTSYAMPTEVERMLIRLSPREREIVRLRVLRDLSVREIATRLAISASTVRVHYYNALGKLRCLFAESGPIPYPERSEC